jgi:serine/threonine protein kinase
MTLKERLISMARYVGVMPSETQEEADERFLTTLPPFAGTLKEELGRGLTGQVYEVVLPEEDKSSVLKLLYRGLQHDMRVTRKLMREAELILGNHHPHIVSVTELVEYRGRYGYVMEHIAGGTYIHWRQARAHAGKALPFLQALRLLAQIADGMWALHEQDIVHRGVGPESILVRDDSHFLLGPPCLVREIDGQHRGVIVPPEYLEKGIVSPPTDVYSWAILAYKVLTGIDPFDAPNVAEALERRRSLDLPSMLTHFPQCPPDLDTLVQSAGSRNPRNRPKSRQLTEDLTWMMAQSPPAD